MTSNSFREFNSNYHGKYTLILGSGFHRNSIGSDSILSSWDKLLEELSPGAELTGEYHLDFEKIIQSKKITCEDSGETEKKLLKCVQKLIKEAQDKVLEDHANCYPLGIFNPEKVSDVISLNFDEVPELLLEKRDGVITGKFVNESSYSKSNKDSYKYLSTRFKLIDFGIKEPIRFWHPHGSLEETDKIILGLHRYSHMLEAVISIRKHHMRAKRNYSTDNTWYYRLLENPVLILGAGMSPTEWDMWFALTSRERANGKTLPIFQMRECECKKDVQHEWFQPLFTGMSFKEQWQELEELFKSK
jgi:hypothetical protein